MASSEADAGGMSAAPRRVHLVNFRYYVRYYVRYYFRYTCRDVPNLSPPRAKYMPTPPVPNASPGGLRFGTSR